MSSLEESFAKYDLAFKGKIRNVYNFDSDRLLIVTTDRISAFDFVFDDLIDNKGILLTKMAKFWFTKTKHIIANHIDNTDNQKLPTTFADRCMLVKKTKVLPIEAIIRGHLDGSAWESYNKTKKVNGLEIGGQYQKFDKLESPIFTPSTKAEVGKKDMNISVIEMKNLVGNDLTSKIIDISFSLYKFAYEYAKERGIIIADTKFEFGIDKDDNLVLIDEIFTPDCSRFWLYEKKTQEIKYESFDKQFFRNYLINNNWDNNQINIPDDIKRVLISKYQLAYDLITS